jgi:hypothetical protein
MPDSSAAPVCCACICRFGVTGYDHLKALMWRETVLQGRNRSEQVYRYTQMVVLAIILATVFLRGEVFSTNTIQVRDEDAPFITIVGRFLTYERE